MTIANSNKTEISLILLDEDPIFTLGLKEVCKSEDFADLNIVATGKLKDIHRFVEQYQIDLWVIALDFQRFRPQAENFLNSLAQLIQEHSQLNIVTIVNPSDLVLDLAKVSFIKGCCYKYTDINELIKTFRLCAKGEVYFSNKDISRSKKSKINNWFYRQCQLGLNEIEQQINQLNNYKIK